MGPFINNIEYGINTRGVDYVVGDIHGCYDQLYEALLNVGFDVSNDRLFSVGDLIDRGPQSFDCLYLILKETFFPVIGNHEMMMLDSVLGDQPFDLWYMNGGNWYEKCDEHGRVEVKYLCRKLVREVPLTMTIQTSRGSVGISHAEPPYEGWTNIKNLDEEDISSILWDRYLILLDDYKVDGVDLTIHGHTPQITPKRVGNSFFIDGGSYLREHNSESEYLGVKVYKLEDFFDKLEETNVPN